MLFERVGGAVRTSPYAAQLYNSGLGWVEMAVFLAVLVCLLASCSGQPGDVVWYVDPTSTADPETCGGEPAQPCASVEVVFAQSLLVNASATCFTSQGDQDGRTSTTVFIMGSVFVPAVCLHNWHNLHVSSYPPGIYVHASHSRSYVARST